MPERTETQKINALITLFINSYKAKYGYAPNINRYREKWGFQDMMNDLGYARAKEIIEFYFTTNRVGHPVIELFRNYDRLNDLEQELALDAIKRLELRRQTEQRVREWEEKIANNRTESN